MPSRYMIAYYSPGGSRAMLESKKLRLSLAACFILLAICSLLAGICQLLFCGHFFTSGIGLWNSVILIIFAIYTVLVIHPQPGTAGFLLILIFSSAATLIIISILSLLFAYQGNRSSDNRILHHMSSAIESRNWFAKSNCQRYFRFLNKNFDDLERSTILTATYISLGVIGLVQLLLGVIVAWKSCGYIYCQPKLAHFHIVFGFLAIIFGCSHTLYCCRYFYIGAGIWTGLFLIATGVYQTRTSFAPKPVVLVLNLLCMISCLTMITLSILGLLCWALDDNFLPILPKFTPLSFENYTAPVIECIEEKDARFSLAKLANGDLYQNCFHGLKVMGYWTHDHVESDLNFKPYWKYAWAEMKLTQVIFTLVLIVDGFFDIILCICLIIGVCWRDRY